MRAESFDRMAWWREGKTSVRVYLGEDAMRRLSRTYLVEVGDELVAGTGE
jgi:hypothetical protein